MTVPGRGRPTGRGRHEVLEDANGPESFDVVVVGGGIHGAYGALLLATAGVRTLLLDRSDFGSETSSRSTKLAHGGLRYLQTFDFRQVLEGIRAREGLFQQAPHLVSPQRFLLPIDRGDWMSRVKIKAGLTLYDLFVREGARRHRWIPQPKLSHISSLLRSPISGAFEYCDGQMNDIRIVLEHIEAARRAGSVCLNYAEVEAIDHGSNLSEIQYRDRVSNGIYTVRAKTVLNCAGPWGGGFVPRLKKSMRFSRGSHIIFRTPWKHQPLFLPIRGMGPGRYYFVLPHFAGTMVGTTEAEIDDPEFQPLPTQAEIDELLTRLKNDLPGTGLTTENAHYAFAGVRALPLRRNAGNVSHIARRHLWENDGRVVTLLGGKYTTYQWTAGEGVASILSMLGRGSRIPVPSDPFPYFVPFGDQAELLQRVSRRAPHLSPDAGLRLVTRLGRAIIPFLEQDHLWEEIFPGICSVELDHAVRSEQAVAPSDLLLRRLETIGSPDFGEQLVPEVIERLATGGIDQTFLQSERTALAAEFAAVRQLLGKS